MVVSFFFLFFFFLGVIDYETAALESCGIGDYVS